MAQLLSHIALFYFFCALDRAVVCVCVTSRHCLIWWWHVQLGEGCGWWQGGWGLLYRQVILNAVPAGQHWCLLQEAGNTGGLLIKAETGESIQCTICPHAACVCRVLLEEVMSKKNDNICSISLWTSSHSGQDLHSYLTSRTSVSVVSY